MTSKKSKKDLPQGQAKILLIDDDAMFRKIFARKAKASGFELESFDSLSDLGFIGKLSEYSLGIIDYDLDITDGVEIANYVEAFCNKVPLLLISAKERNEKKDGGWPSTIKNFVSKEKGNEEILAEVSRLLEKNAS
jgi:DNA-binding response OmpR family regulator